MQINQVPTEMVDDKSEIEIESIEIQYWVGLFEALERLKQNPDFKKVILEGYFKDKAVNGVSLLATDYVKRNGLRSDVMEQLIAISQLEDYFATIAQVGTPVRDDDEDVEE